MSDNEVFHLILEPINGRLETTEFERISSKGDFLLKKPIMIHDIEKEFQMQNN